MTDYNIPIVILNYNNISQYYCIFDQRNVALVNKRSFFYFKDPKVYNRKPVQEKKTRKWNERLFYTIFVKTSLSKIKRLSLGTKTGL